MPPTSALARLQQATTLVAFAAAVAWFVAWWPQRPGVAFPGALLFVFGFVAVLGLQFGLLRGSLRGDPVPTPGAGQLLRAWAGECVQFCRIFQWRQPFRWRAEPDHLPAGAAGRSGIVFVHGFVCNRGFWNPWLRAARARGIPFVAVNLEPVFGSIDDYGPVIEAAVARLAQATGTAPHVVAHSMGGLATRAWLRTAAPGRLGSVTTLGSPHRGTWLGRFSHVRNGRQMALRSDWLQRLAADEAGATLPPFTCWYSNCDNIVFPPSTATLPHADNRLVQGVGHVDLAFQPEVMRAVLDRIAADRGARAPSS